VPQGAGPFGTDHRCPGEWLAIALLEEWLRLLTRAMRYAVPEQDLGVSLTRLPARPRSGVVLVDVRPAQPRP
jgi:fatty-acid peroxygenase